MPPQNLSTDQAARLLEAALDPTAPSSPALSWTPPSVEEVSSWFPEHTVEALIGRGAMGAVYRAVQNRLGRLVAIKLLPAELATAGDFAARFEREARAMAQLSHPNIVAVHDFGRTAAGHAFIVMEHVEGADLSQLLRESPHGLTVPQALAIVGQICDALQYAHGRGCIHRDVKPQNVLVTPDGHVKIADFGLAKLSGIPQSALGMTATGTVLGTPEYVAPEQLKGGAVDHRADIYSLGVMFYEMLTGDLPRGAWEPPSERVPAADTRLDDVVRRAMQREPDRRYQQCSEVKTDVGLAQAGPPPAPENAPAASSLLPGRLGGTLLLGAACFAWRLTPARELVTVLSLVGPFLLLGVTFFVWPRPLRWWGGLIAGLAMLPLAVLFGTTAAQKRQQVADDAPAPQKSSAPEQSVPRANIVRGVRGEISPAPTERALSAASRAEIEGTLRLLSGGQVKLDAGGSLNASNLREWETHMTDLRRKIDRLREVADSDAGAIRELDSRWNALNATLQEQAAKLTTPEALAASAESELKRVEEALTPGNPDPFAARDATSENVQRIQDTFKVPADNPRLANVKRLLADRDEFESLNQRVYRARQTLLDLSKHATGLPWAKLEPEQKAELGKRWDAAITEAEELRKHPRAIDTDTLPSLITALDDLRAVRPDQAAAASGSSPQ